MGKDKKVSFKHEPKSQKIINTEPANYDTHRPSWRFFKARKNSDLYISQWAINSDYEEILNELINLENMNWNDIKHNGSHNIAVESLTERDPQKKLNDAGYDEVFSLRLTGRKRIFGILQNGVLDILWYDKEHEICKSNKKHT